MSEMPYGELARKDFIGFTVVSGTPFPLKGSDEAVQEQTVSRQSNACSPFTTQRHFNESRISCEFSG